MFWIVAGLLTAAALALILKTLTDRQTAENTTGSEEVDVYRAQLSELERDVEAGLVTAEDAAVSRADLERRLLSADERRQSAETGLNSAVSARGRMAAVIVVALTPVAAAGLYLTLGHPEKLGTPERQQAGGLAGSPSPGSAALGETAPSLEVLVQRLEEKLKSAPEDARGWGLLGRTYTVLGQYPEAAAAYRKAAALQPGSAELQSGLGEALALAAGGQVTPEALEAFKHARALDPDDAASRFYLGMADYQRGKFRAALDAWVKLARDAPPDAPWLKDLRAQITTVANQLGVDPETVLPANAPAPASIANTAQSGGVDGDSGRSRGPTREDIQSAAQMSDEDRRDMIQGMVSGLEARLKENPDDARGWRMLARSRRVLGETEKSAEAYRRLVRLRPDDADARAGYALALAALDEAEGERIGDKALAALREVLRLNANHAQTLLLLGKAEQQRGNRAEAERYWRRIIARTPQSDPAREEAERLLSAQQGGGGEPAAQ